MPITLQAEKKLRHDKVRSRYTAQKRASLRDVRWSPMKMAVASVIMGVSMYIPLKLFDQLVFDTTRISGLVLLTGVSCCIGLVCYLFFVWVLGVSELQAFLTILDKVRKSRQVVLEPAQEVVNNGGQEGGAS